MAGFASPDSFCPETSALQLLPIRFERLGADRFLVGNIVGDMAEMTARSISRLATASTSVHSRSFSSGRSSSAHSSSSWRVCVAA